jgi:protein involved in polysaccharide export with SLBB domain
MRTLLLSLVVLASAAGDAVAQQQSPHNWDAEQLEMSRAQLQDLLTRYQAVASSRGYSSTLKARAESEIKLIRGRLDDGDFQVGDRVALLVQGHQEVTDTFTVADDRTLLLPQLGAMPLKGVLRSELQPALASYIGRYIRDPEVRARTLIRIAITGSVRTPGFYVVPSQALLTDVIMTAGGPVTGAGLTRMKILRGETAIWQGQPLAQAMGEGRTLDQLSLRAGDEVIVPEARSGGHGTLILTTLTGVILPTVLYLVVRR